MMVTPRNSDVDRDEVIDFDLPRRRPPRMTEEKMVVDPLDDALDTAKKMAALRVLGGNEREHRQDERAPADPPIKLDLNVGQLISTALAQGSEATKVMMQASQESNAARMEGFMDHLRALQERMEAPGQAPPDPFEVWQRVDGIMRNMREEIRESMGGGQPQVSGLGDSSALVEIKKLELQMQSDNMRWQRENLLQQHQWEVEAEERRADREMRDRHWAAEFQLKKAEHEESVQTRRAAVGGFNTFVEGIKGAAAEMMAEQQKNGSGAPHAHTQTAEPSFEDTSYQRGFRCDDCGTTFPIESAEPGSPATCPNCEAVWIISDA